MRKLPKGGAQDARDFHQVPRWEEIKKAVEGLPAAVPRRQRSFGVCSRNFQNLESWPSSQNEGHKIMASIPK